MSSDTVIAPPGQATVVGNDSNCNRSDKAFEAQLWAQSASHRDAIHLSRTDRDLAKDVSGTAMAIKESETASADRFARLESLIFQEAQKTRDLARDQVERELRDRLLKLEVLAK